MQSQRLGPHTLERRGEAADEGEVPGSLVPPALGQAPGAIAVYSTQEDENPPNQEMGSPGVLGLAVLPLQLLPWPQPGSSLGPTDSRLAQEGGHGGGGPSAFSSLSGGPQKVWSFTARCVQHPWGSWLSQPGAGEQLSVPLPCGNVGAGGWV